MLDLGMAKSFWKVPQFQDLMFLGMMAGASTEGNSSARRQVEKEKRDQLKMMLTLLEQMPHGLQMRVSVNSGEFVWCGLQPEFLTGSPIDIVFKHGATIPGNWNVLGILDALREWDRVGQFATAQRASC
jgi:hypothetical protein